MRNPKYIPPRARKDFVCRIECATGYGYRMDAPESRRMQCSPASDRRYARDCDWREMSCPRHHTDEVFEDFAQCFSVVAASMRSRSSCRWMTSNARSVNRELRDACPIGLSINLRHAIAASPGTGGSARNVDSCWVIASTAQMSPMVAAVLRGKGCIDVGRPAAAIRNIRRQTGARSSDRVSAALSTGRPRHHRTLHSQQIPRNRTPLATSATLSHADNTRFNPLLV